MSQIFVAIAPSQWPPAQMAHQHLCVFEMAVHTFCRNATYRQSSLCALLQKYHRDFLDICKRSPYYGCNSSVSTCCLYTNEDTLEHHRQSLRLYFHLLSLKKCLKQHCIKHLCEVDDVITPHPNPNHLAKTYFQSTKAYFQKTQKYTFLPKGTKLNFQSTKV